MWPSGIFFLNASHFKINNFWSPWVFVAVCRLSVVVSAGRGSVVHCGTWASCRAQKTRSWRTGLGCSVACGIFLDQGLNPCCLHWQADSYLLCQQGVLSTFYYRNFPHARGWHRVFTELRMPATQMRPQVELRQPC